MSDQTPHVPFPLSAFLSQPILDPQFKLIINPRKFQAVYQVRLLESCLRRSPAANYRKLYG